MPDDVLPELAGADVESDDDNELRFDGDDSDAESGDETSGQPSRLVQQPT